MTAVGNAGRQSSSVRGTGRGRGGAISGRELVEVCAGNSGLVGEVDNDGLVTKEGGVRGQSGEEVVVVTMGRQ